MEQNIISLSKTLPLENKTNVINNSSVIEYLNNHQHMAEMMAEYKSLFDNITDSMLLVKPTGEIISVNTAACKEYGYTTEEFLKLSICDLNSPADQLNSNDRFEKIANLGSLIFEVQHQRKDKSQFYTSVSSHKAVYDGNDVLFSICRNISSQKIAEQKIEEQNKELNMVNSEKDRFFSIIAHDLKNPISAVLGLSDLIAKSLHQKDYANAELFTGMITISAANLNTLLTNLFEWAMSCTGRIVFTPSEFNFTKLVMDVFTAHAAIFQRKEIVFEKDLPEKLTMVGDENMLRTVLTNLVSNALKFTNKGGEIIVSAKWLANELKVIVSDNGVGISEKIIPNLFKLDKNVSTYGTNQEKGTGMGIILCKEFVEKHGGRIWVESTVGKGSDFFFTIPNQNN